MLEIRPSRHSDVEQIAAIHESCWREVYHFMPPEVLNGRDQTYRRRQWGTWFDTRKESDALFSVQSGTQIVGFCFCCANADSAIDGRGEMHAAYILPEFRGGPVGPLMMLTMAEFLAGHGLTPMVLWAFKSNPIRIWYSQMGWRQSVTRDRVLLGHSIPEVGYVCHDLDQLMNRLRGILSRPTSSVARQSPRRSGTSDRQGLPTSPVSHGENRTPPERPRRTLSGRL